ncbi:MAG: hypothetical protein HY544_05185 [Candidatus Diapherotrites archaeon]|uniref:Serine dehydratase beta chain domain-containing protein n=1 Tax=Candidatus Iainarchaeum sp. TaxID=3101447 RepID=A0A8T3YMC4_9ARCH|nr:hypothetical protein [Candidatus Diapherotrites archaeon]
MGQLSVFDIIGPVMVGPSSSHTAGAQKLGLEFGRRVSGKVLRLEVTLFNSFADTGEGHGTNVAVVAGVLGISTEDEVMKQALSLARLRGMEVVFRRAYDAGRHPNSVELFAETTLGFFAGSGESLGGGMVSYRDVDLGSVAAHGPA